MPLEHPYRSSAKRPHGEAAEATPAFDDDVMVGAMLMGVGALGIVLGLVEHCTAEWAVALLLASGGLRSARDRYLRHA